MGAEYERLVDQTTETGKDCFGVRSPQQPSIGKRAGVLPNWNPIAALYGQFRVAIASAALVVAGNPCDGQE